ncbi:hypothetical protein ABEB36_004889 [Hypothenemus hampei]|uniref:Microtubule-associated protein Jupiter n=1 Tax=Hypothenemus hampei TaxID=57062 RepID=A0ABD1EX76_HYPHA
MSLVEDISNEEKLLKFEQIEHCPEEKIDNSSEEKITNVLSEEVKTQKINEVINVKPDKDEPTAEKSEAEKKPENDKTKVTVKNISESQPCCPTSFREKTVKNQSDIFFLKNVSHTLQTSIFSVNGSPSRRVFRKHEEHVSQKTEEPPVEKAKVIQQKDKITRENYNDEKRPSSAYRNPLTGAGLSSDDEYKNKSNKKKDGNPILGVGYEDATASASPQHRIPPGGYSHKLW